MKSLLRPHATAHGIGMGFQTASNRIRRRAMVLALSAFSAIAVGCHSLNKSALNPECPASNTAIEVAVFSSLDELAPGCVPPSVKVESHSGITTTGSIVRIEEQVDGDCAIDLTTALQLAGVNNPTINLAREQINEALANQLAARSLLLPTINVGGNFRLHRGALLEDAGFLRTVNSQSLYVGAGAQAIGAGTVALPGVWLFAQLGDAIYEPLAARQRVSGRNADSRAAENSILLDVATAYLDLAGADARLEILHKAESDLSKIVQVTADFAKTGAGTPADANRAAANAQFVRRQIAEAEGGHTAASARLARLLSLDPSIRLQSTGHPIQPFRIIDENAELEALIEAATRMRPELFSRTANLQEARTRVRQERARAWLPLVAVGYSTGLFGGGSNQVADEFSPLRGRSGFGVLAVWNLQNLGAGNNARIRWANAFFGETTANFEIALNQVRREVAEAQAASKVAFAQVGVAQTSLSAAEEGFRLESDRIKQGQGRPIEALDSFRQLLDAKQELLRAIIGFEISQFQLIVAIGGNPTIADSGICQPSR